MIPDVLVQLEASSLTAFLRETLWADASLHILHLVGLAMLVGGASIFDLRLLGRTNSVDLRAIQTLTLIWARVGFGILVFSGSLMFMESPIEMYLNTAFRLKMGLIVVALLNVVVFHYGMYPRYINTNAVKISALVSLVTWFTVLVLGRLIAYV
jgi:hypothetical protein